MNGKQVQEYQSEVAYVLIIRLSYCVVHSRYFQISHTMYQCVSECVVRPIQSVIAARPWLHSRRAVEYLVSHLHSRIKKLEIYLAPSDCPLSLSLPSSARPDSIMSSIKNCSAHSSSIALSLMTIAYSLQPPRRERPTPGLRSEIQTHYSKALNRPLLFTS